MSQLAFNRTPFATMFFLLQRGGVSRKKFRQILLRARGWSEVEAMASALCTGAVLLVLEDGEEVSAGCLVYEKGGCSSYLKIHSGKVLNGTWKRMYIPKETPTIEKLLEFVTRKKSERKPVKLTRRQRQIFGGRKLAGQELTVSEFLQRFRDVAVAA